MARVCQRPGCGVSLAGRPPKTRFCTKACRLEVYKTGPCITCGGPRDGSHNCYCRACMEARWLWGQYRITPAEFAAMLAAQGGRCAICPADIAGDGVTYRRARVDHDHATGRVRGLLCHRCNMGVGYFGDDPARLRAAADYVSSSRSPAA